MEDIMKIVVKGLEDNGLIIKDASETIKNEAKKIKIKKNGFRDTFIGKLGACLLRKMLESKDVIRAVKGTIRMGRDF